MPSVREIVENWLLKNGYDGLADEYGECGCELEDVMPCDEPHAESCVAGHKVECQCGEGCEWHMAPGPRETPSKKEDN